MTTPGGTPTLARTRGEVASALAADGSSRAVVMTMGALHAGHLSLVRHARELADQVVVTIFVNPLQFGAGEDLSRYPRDLEGDLALLTGEGLLGAGDVVLAPTPDVMYPDGDPLVRVSAGPLGDVLEGAVRPGHFDGVLTVVLKLLHLTRPDVALFGRKDAQQLAAVRRMVRDLDVPVEVVGVPLVRDADGLALSSRNAYLSPDERVRALGLSRALRAAQDAAAVEFAPAPAEQIRDGNTITLGFTLPDGTETQISLRAVDAANATGSSQEFVIGADAEATAASFKAALEGRLGELADSELAAASTFAAAENFFNGAGEPVLRVKGDPATATELRIATANDTVMWYSGESAKVSATGLGRTTIGGSGDTVTLTETEPVSAAHGFQITGASTGYTPGDPASLSVQFDGSEAANDTISFTLTEPGGKQREIVLTAVNGKAGPGQFTLAADGDPEKTAANFRKALELAVAEAASDAEGNPRQSVSAAVEDAGRVNYGMQANESGYLRMMRSLAAMSVETYPEITNAPDPDAADLDPAKARFDAMARRHQLMLSEAHNSERGSIELVTMELGVAHAALQSAGKRHTNYQAQLENLLSDVETVDKEEVAMQILALQTRLTASYQVTSMVSQLSLVNFL